MPQPPTPPPEDENPAPVKPGDRLFLASVDSFAMPIEPTLSEAIVTSVEGALAALAIEGAVAHLDNGAAVDLTTMQIIEADRGVDGDIWIGTAFRDETSRSEHIERERLWLALRLFCSSHAYPSRPSLPRSHARRL